MFIRKLRNDIFAAFRTKKWFKCLDKCFKFVGLNQRNCILCDFKEIVTSVLCDNCNILYCFECWVDLEAKCVGCESDYLEEILDNE